MRNLICLLAISAAAVQAQQPGELARTARAADKASATWENLAKALEAKIDRMLPCDPRVKSAIEEVKNASDVRLTALNNYFQAAAAQAKRQSETARTAAETAQAAAHEIETDRAEAEQERIAVEGQLADLAESIKRRPSLQAAQKKLEAVAEIVRRRSDELQQQAGQRTAVASGLADVAALRQARQRTLDARLTALALESSRWGDYYIARLARAQTECSITNAGAPAQRRKPR